MIWFLTSIFGWLGVLFARQYYGIPFLILLVFLSAFRYYVGSDFDDYVNLYNHAVLGLDIPVEHSYLLMSLFLDHLGFNFQSLIAVYTLLTYIFIYMGLKEVSHDKQILGVLIFFVYIIFFFPSLSIMRQALAVSIAFWGAYRFLYRESFLKFLIAVAVASFFHVSSVVYLLLIPFYIFKPKPVQYLFGIVITALIGFTVFGSIVGYVADVVSFGFKGYKFQPTPLPPPVFLFNTFILGCVFVFFVLTKFDKDYFLMNIIFFILVIRLLAMDFLPITRIAAGFTPFIAVFVVVTVYSRLANNSSRIIFFIITLSVLLIKNSILANKDYSYYQYSINLCIYGDPCPVSIIGDLPLEDLLIPEVRR